MAGMVGKGRVGGGQGGLLGCGADAGGVVLAGSLAVAARARSPALA